MQGSNDGDTAAPALGLDERGQLHYCTSHFVGELEVYNTEFDEAFRVFSSSGSGDSRSIAKTNSVLVPFLKSVR